MAWECNYTASLIITHSTVTADEISRRLHGLVPQKAVSVGDVRTFRSGRTRSASNTVWISRLHADEKLHGSELDINELLRQSLPRLAPYESVLAELSDRGFVSLELHLWFDTVHTAFVLEPDVLAALAKYHLALDMEIYH